MSKLDKSLLVLDAIDSGSSESRIHIDPRAAFLVTIIYLCFILGIPTEHVDIILWYALYPIIASPMFGLKYSSVLLQSLIVLPLVLMIGLFNPIIDREAVAIHEGFVITRGWLTFIGLVVRGLLSMQALLLLIRPYGFRGMVRSMERLGIPKFLTTQLLMVFRYVKVLIEEGLSMRRAREARGYGEKHLSVKMWGTMIGQLFIRSVVRSERVHKAMLARGFDGEIPVYSRGSSRWSLADGIYLVAWGLFFLFLRLFNLSLLFV